MADGLGARCPPSCFFMGARLPNADIRHAIPERQAVTDQCREVVAKELSTIRSASEPLSAGNAAMPLPLISAT